MTLADAKDGEILTVLEIEDEKVLVEGLRWGITPGSTIKVEKVIAHGPVIIRKKHVEMAIMSDKPKKTDNRLVCNQCNYPLIKELFFNSNSKETKCPRCNSVIGIESPCDTSCHSCQSQYQQNHSSCEEKIVSIDITNNNQEKTCKISESNVEKKEHGQENSGSSMLLKAWRILKKSLFQVK